MTTKRCSKGQHEVSRDNFAKSKKSRDGLQPWCNECNKAYQRAHRARNPELARARDRRANVKTGALRTRRYREANPERATVSRLEHRRKKRDFVKALKAEKGCQRCDVRDFRVLDLHHRDDSTKDIAVSQAITRRGWPALMAEIEKCDVLCANCHRIAHAEEAEAAG